MESKLFHLRRDVDTTGLSGTGVVADGVIFPDDTVALRWRGDTATTVLHSNIDSVRRLHTHGGNTTIVGGPGPVVERTCAETWLNQRVQA